MLGFIVRRVLSVIPVLLIVAVLVFLMLRLVPGDPAAVIAGDTATDEQVQALRARMQTQGEDQGGALDTWQAAPFVDEPPRAVRASR